MRTVYEREIANATKIQRNIVQGTARICSSSFGACWKALHPHKSAEVLADAIGCSVRTAAYQISGEHEPSAKAIAALVNECTE